MSCDATRRRLDALTDHVGFQDLVTILLARTGVNVRPLGGPGDRGRDAVAGLYRAKGGEPLAVTISLERDWCAKIRADLKRIHDCGFRPKTVTSVTNRLAAGGAGPQAMLWLEEAVSIGILTATVHLLDLQRTLDVSPCVPRVGVEHTVDCWPRWTSSS